MTEVIEFIVSTEKQEYLLGEPILVNCEVKNISNDIVEVLDKFEADYDIVTYHVVKSSEKDVSFVPYAVMDFLPESIPLKPQDSIFGMSKIFYGGKGWTFDKPGNYKIWATYNGLSKYPEKVIKSNVLEIKVNAPVDDQEKEQADLIMGKEQGLFLLYDGGDDLSDGLKNLNALKDKFPESNLSSYVNFSIGESLTREFKDFKKKKVRPADPSKALDYLKKSKDKLPKELECQAYMRMADCCKTMDTTEEENILDEFIAKFSDDRRYAKAVEEAKKKHREH